MNPKRWLTAAAFLTWAAAGYATEDLDGQRFALWLVAFLAYGAALAVCMLSRTPAPRWVSRTSVAVQSIAGLAMVAIGREPTAAATLVVAASQLPGLVPSRVMWLWVGAQTVILAPLLAPRIGLTDGVALALAFAAFQVFAMATMTLMHSERALLAENARADERLRIARDLHDTLGHHLTALSLQLDVASRLTDGPAADKVREAHAITRLLLSDVRSVVSEMRDTTPVDIVAALRPLVDQRGAVAIHLDAPSSITLKDASQAHALVRCVQEIITNTSRHAGAHNLWIELVPRDGGIVLRARDDGRGADAVAWGNGLTGMRERFEEHSGRVDVTSGAGRGFEINGFMPSSS